ncbi:uncharacterized protein Dana_GF18684 [Drosophila ananassae]|uniref:MARVEL domain-containing protein n=1 Tax=Drosophila ananassae TaxID=7217 RepID=B3LX15_DROAN|nr:uncharacterized protein LOC6501455 [Drosophila ananassae]EDV43854.1 uncharacterized protein Dana_GF18684 [Drosophila ananassae]KAH8326414.1 hypothetical protein KR067_006698 [Drosophila pandora]
MSCPYRVINFVLQLLTAILEVVATVFVVLLLWSPCVLGLEFSVSPTMCLFIRPVMALHSVVFVLFRLCCCTVGLDPIAVVFNFIAGVAVTCSSLFLLIDVIMYHCGNEYLYMFYIVGIFGLLAGIMHLVNAFICNRYMPASERLYLKPSKRQRKKALKVRLRENK